MKQQKNKNRNTLNRQKPVPAKAKDSRSHSFFSFNAIRNSKVGKYCTPYFMLKGTLIPLYFIVCFVFFAFYYQYHFYYFEQMQLFRLSWDYVADYLHKPAFLSSLAGDFLIQFYYLRFGGPVVVTVCLLLLWYLLDRCITRIFSWKYAYLLSLFVTAVVTCFHFTIVYPLAATVSFIIALLVFLLYTLLNNTSVKMIAGIVMAPLFYFATGLGVYVFLLMVLLYEFKTKQIKKEQIWAYGIVLVLAVSVSPFLMRKHYYLTMGQAYSYPVKELVKPVPDLAFESILSIDCEWYFNHPEKVLELTRKNPVRNHYVTYYYNMASAALGQLPNNFLSFDQKGLDGIFIPFRDNDQTNYLSILFGNEIYYFIGDMNTSQHYALLANTFSPKCVGSRMVRRLAETNIINGEYAAAGKYLKMLEQTMFYRKWAREAKQYLYNDALCSKTPWIAGKRAQMPLKDHIAANPNYFIDTLDNLLEDHPDNQAALDYLLCTYLLYKDIESFYKALTTYKHNCKEIYLPKLYQEALVVYFGTHKDVTNFQQFKFSRDIVQQSMLYQKEYNESQGNGNLLYQDFENSYLYYYGFAKLPG
jgi:hypothetical protein